MGHAIKLLRSSFDMKNIGEKLKKLDFLDHLKLDATPEKRFAKWFNNAIPQL
jgi:hypothetical protein